MGKRWKTAHVCKVALCLLALTGVASESLAAAAAPHLPVAQALVAALDAQANANNSYTYTLPPAIQGGPAYVNHDDCSSFFEALLEHAYKPTADQLETLPGTTKATDTIRRGRTPGHRRTP